MRFHVLLFTLLIVGLSVCDAEEYENKRRGTTYLSILGDPGMTSDHLRVELEAWNFCNGATGGPTNFPSPRYADCFDVDGGQLVSDLDNSLAPPDPIPHFPLTDDENTYAVEKEQYLANLCAVKEPSTGQSWFFWNVMMKSGNFDSSYNLCPITSSLGFICWNSSIGCMNQPRVQHNSTSLTATSGLQGSFSGTYDIYAPSPGGAQSFFEVVWRRERGSFQWTFDYTLTTSHNYPWLMWYHRADAATGIDGGYASDGRGMMLSLPTAPDFLVKVFLNITEAPVNAPVAFYMPEMAACWKLNGSLCNGDVKTDVTRYFEFVVSPVPPCGNTTHYLSCPPYHTFLNGTRVARTDPRFPFSAYRQWCSPPGSPNPSSCDPYSNPQPQELIMARADPEWGSHGFPTKQGEGWVGDARLWELNVGELTNRMYFTGVAPSKKTFYSLNVGPEQFAPATLKWSISQFDVLVPSSN